MIGYNYNGGENMNESTNKYFHTEGETISLHGISLEYESGKTSFSGFLPIEGGITTPKSPKEEEIIRLTKELNDLIKECTQRYAHEWAYNSTL